MTIKATLPMITCRVTRLLAAAAIFSFAAGGGAIAQQPIKIFDSHMHYNGAGTNAFFTLDQVIDTFRKNSVAGVVANSRPNRGTQQLVEAKAPGLWVVPFIRPYRVESDVGTWYTNPEIYDLIESEFKRGYYKGVGEFHIYGDQTKSPLVKKTVDFAVANDLWLLAHSDEAAIPILHAHNPKAKVIWAHTGFGAPTSTLREYLEKYSSMMAELSYRSGITESGARLSADWRDLFAKYSDRFLLGSDTWVNGRWTSYGDTMAEYRGWLGQLPPEQARRVAHGNAERIYGGKIE